LAFYACFVPIEFRRYDLLAGRFAFNADPLAAALLFAGCTAGLAVGEFGALQLLERRRVSVDIKRSLLSMEFWILALLFSLASAVSLAIGGGGSYREYVSGATIGWGVTLAFVAGGAIPLALLTPCPLYVRLILILIGTLPGALITFNTGVRLLLLIPAGSFAVALIARGIGAHRPIASLVALVAAVPVVALVNNYVLRPLRGTHERHAFFPEAEVVALYMRMMPHVEPSSDGPLAPVIRFFSGLISFPAAQLGVPLSTRTDPATGFARAIHGEWASYFSHMPMTFALDFFSTTGSWAAVTAVLFGALFAMADRALRSDPRLLIVFAPAFAVSVYLFARGAVSHAGTAISAVVFFGIVILLGLALSRILRRHFT
jgi:hypothetical protein